MAEAVYTVGHSTLSQEEFLRVLEAHRIAMIVDVRRFPASRRYPHFNGANMQQWLGEASIGYRHVEALGGRRPARKDSPNTGWKNDGFRGYADYMQTREFGSALDELIGLAGERRVAIMCAEAVPWRCHRNLVADALVLLKARPVFHITSVSAASPHKPAKFAQVRDGFIFYPAPEGDQGTLFAG